MLTTIRSFPFMKTLNRFKANHREKNFRQNMITKEGCSENFN